MIKELGHGVTIFKGQGGYTKDDQKVLFCVIPTNEYFVLKENTIQWQDSKGMAR